MIKLQNKNTQAFLRLSSLFLLLNSCSSNQLEYKTASLASREIATSHSFTPTGPVDFPELTIDKGELAEALKLALKKSSVGMPEDEFNRAAERLRHYLSFLGLTAKDFKKAAVNSSTVSPEGTVTLATPITKPASSKGPDDGDDEDDKTPSNLKAIQRLFIASTQFLDCQNLLDWECLEKSPSLKPKANFRTESKENLGAPIIAGNSLDMDVFFTEAWDGSPRSGVVDHFTEKLEHDVGKSLSIAMYGIDDIKGTMSGVYNAIVNHSKIASENVRAVIDVSGFEKGTVWNFDYVTPDEKSPNFQNWMFGNSQSGIGMHTTFQYDGTPDFIHVMNDGIKTQEESRVRIEWPTSHIMHNKFAVLENHQGIKSVWTGTANISNHCMGAEANSNMSVYIRNDYIAKAYLDEFNLMFNFDPSLLVKSKLVKSSDEKNPAMTGRFHRNKYPVSNRFFKFNDGTNVRVHFAPTDDAEHRVILPMLLSAKSGDEIRISMFGGTGYEIVRAMQFAVAKGANVRIVFDSKLGHGLSSWIRDRVLNVFMKNPYIGRVGLPSGSTPGSISVRSSTWKGKNHYKVGSLSRKLPNGEMRAEQIIVGSQNWSSGGNDNNDENLISIQNIRTDVPAAILFNNEFDNRLWVKSREEKPRLN